MTPAKIIMEPIVRVVMEIAANIMSFRLEVIPTRSYRGP